ncbi:MAG: cell surface protein, partial [Opitutaceae bacterium]
MSLYPPDLFRLAARWLPFALAAVQLTAASLTEVRVHPVAINLEGSGDRQSFIVQARYDDGVTRDVTAEASVADADKRIASLAAGVVSPAADGRTELRVKFKGRAVVVPVSVVRAKVADAISFTKDVMPVLTKAGCNSGGCHGASRG